MWLLAINLHFITARLQKLLCLLKSQIITRPSRPVGWMMLQTERRVALGAEVEREQNLSVCVIAFQSPSDLAELDSELICSV